MSVFLVVHLNTASKTYFTKRKSMKLKPLEIGQQVNLSRLLGRRSFASQHNLSKSRDLSRLRDTRRKGPTRVLQNLQEDSLVREFQEVPVARVVLECQAILGNLVVPLQKQTNKQ